LGLGVGNMNRCSMLNAGNKSFRCFQLLIDPMRKAVEQARDLR